MFRRYILCLVAMSLLATSNIAQSGSKSTAPENLIGYLRKEHYTDMYGCTYFIKGHRTLPIFFDESMGRGGEVLMNVDGADVNLKFVRTVRLATGRRSRGRRQSSDYTAAGLKVRVNRVRGQEVGSGTEYSGTLTAVRGRRKQTVRITGFCGA
jgi:hypothetical protein